MSAYWPDGSWQAERAAAGEYVTEVDPALARTREADLLHRLPQPEPEPEAGG